ncbi:hypothetical protein [Spirosoma sp. KNUC1025]|uniref:hypothetical protein n=1 Tax=Spirosoma sp. KNUC1025 TaxID=2894082 RepID=UPI00386EBA01
MLDEVARKLGNTRTVCRKHYVHPQILEAYECQDLAPYIQKKNRFLKTSPNGLDGVEKLLLRFLKDQVKNGAKSQKPTRKAQADSAVA